MSRVVIVTGAAGGLGSEVARKFGEAGDLVVVSDIARAEEAAGKLAGELGKGRAFAYLADVRSYQEMRGLVRETLRKWHRIDVLVNTAGGTLSMITKKDNKLLVHHSDEEWDLVVDTNLKGSFHCLKAVAPPMMEQREGHVILVSSGQGVRPGPLMSSYAAAKAGVFGLMKAAARELGEYNIKVNAVNPGFILHSSMATGGFAPDRAAQYTRDTTLGRMSTPADFADFVVYLSRVRSISGQTFNLDSRVLY